MVYTVSLEEVWKGRVKGARRRTGLWSAELALQSLKCGSPRAGTRMLGWMTGLETWVSINESRQGAKSKARVGLIIRQHHFRIGGRSYIRISIQDLQLWRRRERRLRPEA